MAQAPSTVEPQTPRIVHPHIHRADRLSKELDTEDTGRAVSLPCQPGRQEVVGPVDTVGSWAEPTEGIRPQGADRH